MKYLILLLLIILTTFKIQAQPADCVFKKPILTIHFGVGNVRELNSDMSMNYDRVSNSCPTDGHYTYTSYTSDCFRGDWHTITEDHTPGDAGGNMMLVNASPRSGRFLTTNLNGLKSNTPYEFSVWMMNVCRITDKCPFPLLPDISIVLVNQQGTVVAQFGLGELPRTHAPEWTPYRAMFTTPASEDALTLIMTDNAPGGCGNDFVLDDISFRECEKPTPVVIEKPKTAPHIKQQPKSTAVIKTQTKTTAVIKPQPKGPALIKQQPKPPTTVAKKEEPVKRKLESREIGKLQTDTVSKPTLVTKQKQLALPPPPTVLITRSNPVIRQIETEAAQIKLDLYDNGQIDGDTVSIYHNNQLMVSHARLTEKAITFYITVDPAHPHHELIMVAENLGSIPPNTSLMIITAGTTRYDVFISSTEQKNAKIVIDLK